KSFSYREVILYGFATAIDALAAGVAMHADLSTTTTVWLHVAIILALTLALSLVGLFLGRFVMKLFRGRYEISGIIGGSVLILLAVWVVLSHYLSI
nr:manganese efflux pump MntP family protein [Bacilli bacterium]